MFFGFIREFRDAPQAIKRKRQAADDTDTALRSLTRSAWREGTMHGTSIALFVRPPREASIVSNAVIRPIRSIGPHPRQLGFQQFV